MLTQLEAGQWVKASRTPQALTPSTVIGSLLGLASMPSKVPWRAQEKVWKKWASPSQGQDHDSACLAQKVPDQTRSIHVDAGGYSLSP